MLSDLFKSSEGNGHDFGFLDETGVDPKQARGVISSLSKKGWFDYIDDPWHNGFEMITQFAFRREDVDAIGAWIQNHHEPAIRRED